MFNKKKRYLAIFLIKEQNSFTIVGKKLFNPNNPEISYSGKAYIIKTDKSTYSKGLTQFYFLIKDTKQQLLFSKHEKSDLIDTALVDSILSKKIIKQLTSDLGNTDYRSIIFYLIIGLTIGGLIGFIIGKGGFG